MTVALFPSAADGIACEEALLSAGRTAVLLWYAEQSSLVIPKCQVHKAGWVWPIESTAGTWPILIRQSGGGVVPQGKQTLNLAMILPCPSGFTIEDGFRLICGAIADALSSFDVAVRIGPCTGSFCDGRWNILYNGCKLAGTAQRWRTTGSTHVALLHAAILLSMPARATWQTIDQIQCMTGYKEAGRINPDAHVALENIMPAVAASQSFTGALVRSAEDHLGAIHPRIDQVA